MNKKLIFIALFFIVAIIQLYVPATFILQNEEVLEVGTMYKFRTAAIDPYDPFRGKYITLWYEENRIAVENTKDWGVGQTVYILLDKDESDFVRYDGITKEIPSGNVDYLQTSINYIPYNDAQYVEFVIPFTRFYLEESKAKEAENAYNEAAIDSTLITYAKIKIKDGKGVLEDVIINESSVKDIITK
ncbi:GDYXXLXY domain-containing protein [Flammeovirga agarivorans]|uniref:GDYXXLXY domain-containing protein n=1 Tax=Flammeovirga agarivorans TaxID=2726742 RepID=A0A7X8SH33_9BACT|nr:GDYXXLXY domain-containing protein [Flammeovirga agarivorans]NLR90131.1 GDYXXLXY domain-containing protein [Flammeovirga agarivorans]